jgi:hypothetical protein
MPPFISQIFMKKSLQHLILQSDYPFSTWWKRGTLVVEKGCLCGGKGLLIWWKRGTWMVEMGYLCGGKGVPGKKYAVLDQFLGYYT